MAIRELSRKERDSLMQRTAIAMILTGYFFMGVFFYLMENKPILTTWDFLFQIGLPFLVGCVLAGMITFEVSYQRKVKSCWVYHAKRLAGQLILLLSSSFSFVGFVGLLSGILFQKLGTTGFLLASFIYAIIYATILIRFRKVVGRLTEGSW